MAITLANAKIEPAARKEVKRCSLLCQQDRVVPRKHHRSRTQTKRCRSRCQPRQKIQRGGHRTPTCKVVFDEVRAVVPERFRFYVQIDVVEEALADACTQRRTV